MYNILTLNKIASVGTDNFDVKKYNIGTEIEKPRAILVRSASMHEYEIGNDLRAVARAGAGVNNIPIDKLSEKGVVVFNTPGANANAVKELVITGLFLSSRKIVDGINWAQTLKGKDDVPALVEKGKADFGGVEVKGKTLGVIGLGAIGVLVANAAAALGMNVIGADPYLCVDTALRLDSRVKYVKTNDEIFAASDYISLHVPFNDKTKGLINEQSLKKIKNGAKILNFARNELVDNAAVVNALSRKVISAYITDFPSDDLLGIEGVVAIPHLGASSEESEDNCAIMAVNEVMDYLENGNITNSVNLPNSYLPITGDAKITVIHKNVDGVIAHITGILASKKINIENSISGSKKDYAYSAFDVKGFTPELKAELAAEIAKNTNVTRVRIIRN